MALESWQILMLKLTKAWPYLDHFQHINRKKKKTLYYQ